MHHRECDKGNNTHMHFGNARESSIKDLLNYSYFNRRKNYNNLIKTSQISCKQLSQNFISTNT